MKNLNEFLEKNGLSGYLFQFRKFGINLSELIELTDKELLEIGINSEEHRKKILASINSFDKDCKPDDYEREADEINIAQFLSRINLDKYFQFFVKEQTTFESLLNMNEDDLSDFGIKERKHRRKILSQSKKIKEANDYLEFIFVGIPVVLTTISFFLPIIQFEDLVKQFKILNLFSSLENTIFTEPITGYFLLQNFTTIQSWTPNYSMLQFTLLYPALYVTTIILGWITVFGFFIKNERVENVFGVIWFIFTILLFIGGIPIIANLVNESFPFERLGIGIYLLFLSPIISLILLIGFFILFKLLIEETYLKS